MTGKPSANLMETDLVISRRQLSRGDRRPHHPSKVSEPFKETTIDPETMSKIPFHHSSDPIGRTFTALSNALSSSSELSLPNVLILAIIEYLPYVESTYRCANPKESSISSTPTPSYGTELAWIITPPKRSVLTTLGYASFFHIFLLCSGP